MVREATREWVKRDVTPIIEDYAQRAEFPRHLVKGLAEVGAFGPYIPAEYGGAGLDQISYGLMMMEIERGDSGIRSTCSVQSSLVMYPIYAFGNEEQRRKYLPKLANGEWLLPVSLWTRDRIGPWSVAREFPGADTFKDAHRDLDPIRMANVYASSDQGKTWTRRGGVTFPTKVRVGSKELRLNGAGLRQVTLFNIDVYAAALTGPWRGSAPSARCTPRGSGRATRSPRPRSGNPRAPRSARHSTRSPGRGHTRPQVARPAGRTRAPRRWCTTATPRTTR
jgi:hypothetical protein